VARLSRLLLLLVPVALGTLSAALPGGAQEAGRGRYAFADTTLLRDTLSLHFTRLFPLADSLEMTPDTLRALSVRYQWSLERLLVLSDSLGVPVDSVGPVLMRERFNPLAGGGAGAGRATDFVYNSSYSINQTNTGWRNSGDFSLRAGSIFLQNSTSIQMDRFRATNGTSLQDTRGSVTEVGWRFSPDFSLGGRADLQRYDSNTPGVGTSISETHYEYQMSMRSRQRPMRGMSSTLNFLGGVLDLQNASLQKRGLSGNLNGRMRYNYRSWLVHELNGTVDGNLSRTRVPSEAEQSTQDYSANIRGLVNLFQTARVGLKNNFSYRHVQVETPLPDSAVTQRALTDQWGADGTMRLREDNDRYVDMQVKTSTSKQATVKGARSRNTRREDGFYASGRYLLAGWSIEPRFTHSFATAEFPDHPGTGGGGGYSEFLHARTLDGTLTRQVSRSVNLQLSGSIGLNSLRYTLIGSYPALPVSRDTWRQSWRAKGSYSPSERFTTSIALDVSKNSLINIPSASTGSNNTVRSYRSDWTWSYRLMTGLTATQVNTVSADYQEYPFFPDNNRLTLDYGNLTTLNAVVTPHLNISLTHSLRETPGGNYTLYPDNLYYFERADETKNSSIRANIAYSPSPAISFGFRPNYYSTKRVGTVNGIEVPQRNNGTLDFSGGANINVPVGRKGTLRGDIGRTYRAERTITYSSGVAQQTPLSEVDYWNGSLQLTWTF
jgi:hypothetical protein